MPLITITERQDRGGPVNVNVGGSKNEKLTLERGKQHRVSNAVLEALKVSHEAPYLRVIKESDFTSDDEAPESEQKRLPGRPKGS